MASNVVNAITDALQKAIPEIENLFSLSDFESAVNQRAARVFKFRDYADGEHDAKLTAQMKKMLRVTVGEANLNEFNLNQCDNVIQTLVDRLLVLSIASKEEDTSKWIESELLEPNKFTAVQGALYEGAVRDGDTYMMATPKFDAGGAFQGVRWTIEPAFDGSWGMLMIHDGAGDPLVAVKAWSLSRATLSDSDDGSSVALDEEVFVYVYVRGVIFKFTGSDFGSVSLMGDKQEDGTREGVEITNLPIPIVQFSNKLSRYNFRGKSEIKDIIPAQNALNRTMHSVTMASELAAFGVRVAVGFDIGATDADDGSGSQGAGITPGAVFPVVLKDSGGNRITDPTPEQIALLNAVRLEEFTATQLLPYIELMNFWADKINDITRTPNQSAGANASGEALKQREVGLLGKAKRFQSDNGEPWERLVRISGAIWSKWAAGSAPDLDGIRVIWQDPEIRNDRELIESVAMVSDKINVFPESVYREIIGKVLFGMSAEEIKAAGDEFEQQAIQRFSSLLGGAGGTDLV